MTIDDPEVARLKDRFAAPPPGGGAGEGCPDPDRIWRAAHGELAWSQTEDLLSHTAACPACTVAWRMAREQAIAGGVSIGRRPAGNAWVRYAAAAVVLIVLGGLVVQRSLRKVDESAFRATSPNAIVAATGDGVELARSGFHLRWTPGPTGTRYAIQVTDERLATIVEAAGLSTPEFRVPEAALLRLPAGARVFWQVKAVSPDGERVTSATFLVKVGG
jgi:hypothetical protein